MEQTQILICQLCGKSLCGKQHGQGNETNYQKIVDPPTALCGNEKRENRYPPACTGPPLITCTPCVEYRVTSEVRGKPANIPGLLYIMNHGLMEREDVEAWIEKKKKMAEKNMSWVGDGTYLETHPEMLHFYGATTHLFLKNPEKPYGDPSPVRQPPYTQILPDQRYDEDEKRVQERKGKSVKPDSKPICVSIPIVFGQNKDNGKGESKKVEGSEAKEKEKEKEKETEKEKNAASPATKASCLPMGGQGCPPPVKMMLCLPCPPPNAAGTSSGPKSGPSGSCKPKDYTYRCESRELRAGNLYSCCQCVKRNGLQHDCPRSPCQGRSACLTKPWPDCWPSGGCHGIDFTREKGTKRYNPCSAQRFDNKVCNPPGGPPKSDCGGQMMVVVCPPPK